MLMLCIIFDKRDVAVDKIRGLQSLITKMNPTTIKQLYNVVLLAYLFCSIYFFKNAFPVGILQPLIMTLILWFAFKKSLQQRGYLFYYFFIDGLMLLSLAASYFTQI
jgi:4-hydroxybenzoate polyprenyltransferase